MHSDLPTVNRAMWDEIDRCSCGLVLQGRLGQAYNEEAFRYLLSTERNRAECSGRPFLLLLASIRGESGLHARLDPQTAARLFSGLTKCLRDTDLIGWYRSDRVAGAVLTESAAAVGPDFSWMSHRIARLVSQELPSSASTRLHVRIRQVRPRPRS